MLNIFAKFTINLIINDITNESIKKREKITQKNRELVFGSLRRAGTRVDVNRVVVVQGFRKGGHKLVNHFLEVALESVALKFLLSGRVLQKNQCTQSLSKSLTTIICKLFTTLFLNRLNIRLKSSMNSISFVYSFDSNLFLIVNRSQHWGSLSPDLNFLLFLWHNRFKRTFSQIFCCLSLSPTFRVRPGVLLSSVNVLQTVHVNEVLEWKLEVTNHLSI